MGEYTALDHENEIVEWVENKIRPKYRAGQEEHGGKLWRKPMLGHMIEEATDLVVYLQTHQMQQLQLISLLTEAYHAEADYDRIALIRDALNLLLVGNVEGQEEEERA